MTADYEKAWLEEVSRANGLQAHLDYLAKKFLDYAVVTEGKVRASYTDAYAEVTQTPFAEATAKVRREAAAREDKREADIFDELLKLARKVVDR